ncbi:MAG: amine oxidase, partial [Alphaproteobacteria bacterium HGW-Alphaproteobacteria-16]
STTRRALLRGFAASGIAAAVPTAAPAYAGTGRVAIIGGGIAGLTALHHLREAGVDARLYEARARLGGRIHTLRVRGEPALEMGAQLVNSDHADIHALARRFGVALTDRKAAPHEELVIVDGRVMDADRLADALRPIAAQIGDDADRIDRDPAALRAFDALSLSAYLDRHAALMPQPWVRRLLEASARTEYGAEPGQTSALSLLFNLPTVDGQRADILGGSDERFSIRGGSSTLTDAIAARYADRIERNRRLVRIERATGGVHLRFADGERVTAERAILAVPAPIARGIEIDLPLPHDWRRFIATVDLGRNEKLLAVSSDPRWRARIGTGGSVWRTDGGCASGWEGSVVADEPSGPAVWTWYLGGDEVHVSTPPRILAAQLAASSDAALGGMMAACSDGAVRRTGWHRDPLTLGAYGSYPPGHLTRFGHLLWLEGEDGGAVGAAPDLGRIVLAGEHLSDAFPGYMNGGAQTGRLAAQAIIGRTVRV